MRHSDSRTATVVIVALWVTAVGSVLFAIVGAHNIEKIGHDFYFQVLVVALLAIIGLLIWWGVLNNRADNSDELIDSNEVMERRTQKAVEDYFRELKK